MECLRRITKPVCYVVATCLISLNLNLPTAHAAMVSTEAVVYNAESGQHRNLIRAALNRKEVVAQLVASGVDPAQVIARVDALTDAEAQRLARHLDEMPAGGNSIIGAAVFIFLVLVVTDLLGLTNVFSFTNKGSARR